MKVMRCSLTNIAKCQSPNQHWNYISQIAKYVTYRMTAPQHMKEQVFKSKQKSEDNKSVFSSKSNDNKFEQNIKVQMSATMSSSLLSTIECTRGLVNPFTNVKAQDQYCTLRNASVNAPNRRRTLQTFSTKKVNRKRVSQLERHQRLVLTAMKKKILFSKKLASQLISQENSF